MALIDSSIIETEGRRVGGESRSEPSEPDSTSMPRVSQSGVASCLFESGWKQQRKNVAPQNLAMKNKIVHDLKWWG